MKFECNRKKLINLLKGFSKSCISHAYLRAEKGSLFLGGKEGDRKFLTSFDALVYMEGEFLIPLWDFFEYLNKLDSDFISIEKLKEKNTYSPDSICVRPIEKIERVCRAFFWADFSCQNYLEMEKPEGDSFSIESMDFFKAMNKTLYAVSHDENRPMLCGLCFDFSKQGFLSLVSTDGNRLAINQIEIEGSFSPSKKEKKEKGDTFIINTSSVMQLKDLILGYQGRVSFTINKDGAYFEIGDTTVFYAPFIGGIFPDYKNIIPSYGEENFIQINRNEFLKAIQISGALTDRRSSRVFLDIKDSSLLVSGEKERESFAEIEILLEESTPKTIKAAFSYKYLVQAISSIHEPSFFISYENNHSIFLFQNEGKNEKHLIMPMNVD